MLPTSRPPQGTQSRIVSLLPSATEILFAIGAGDDVVAVTHECDYPSAAGSRPVITSSAINHDGSSCAAIDRHIKGALHTGSGIYRLDETLLASLAPTLIVTQELCDVCAVAYRQVAEAVRELPGTVPILSLEPRGLDDILTTVELVGQATHREVTAAEVVRRLRGRIDAVTAMPPPGHSPRTVCVEWTDPLMVGGHWVPEMVHRAGAVDALGVAAEPSRWIQWDDVLTCQPELMVLMPCGFGLHATLECAADLVARPGFAALPCARAGRVVAVDGSAYFNRPGPRIVEGLALLAAIVRARPGDRLPSGAAWVSL